MAFLQRFYSFLDAGSDLQPSKDPPITFGLLSAMVAFAREEKDDWVFVVEQLIGLVDLSASIPLSKSLLLCVEKLKKSPSLFQIPCDLLYPGANVNYHLDYLTTCRRLGITESDLRNQATKFLDSRVVTNAVICEVVYYCESLDESVNCFTCIFQNLFQVELENPKSTWIRAKRVLQKWKDLKKSRNQSKLDAFLNDHFDLICKQSCVENIAESVAGLKLEMKTTEKETSELERILETAAAQCRQLETVRKEKDRLQTQLHASSGLATQLDSAKKQMAMLRRSRRHYMQAASAKDREVRNLSGQVEEKAEQIRALELEVLNITSALAEVKEETQKLAHAHHSLKSYHKRRRSSTDVQERVKELNEEITFWQNRSMEYEEQVKAFTEQRDIVTFRDGKYTDDIRQLYMELMAMCVGSRNIERIIRTVLKRMLDKDVDRLPKESFAKYMLLEGRHLALEHLQTELMGAKDTTLGTDGTSKYGHHYGTAQISTTEGSFVMGLRDMSGGTAEEYLDLVKDIIGDISSANGDSTTAEIVMKMRNTISDQASSNKKLNSLLEIWRESMAPQVIPRWDSMTEDERMGMVKMNNFWCSLHLLVGLSEQANKTLAVWEDLVHHGKKVGAEGLPGGYSKPGESGTTRLVRTTCKAVHERGCERSGRPVEFRDYLDNYGLRKKIPLHPFIGNRFNILFHNGAGVYYLLKDLLEFTRMIKDQNRLFAAVESDLNVLTYQAGIRALGILAKAVTEPLWRTIAKGGHIKDLTKVFQEMERKFKIWSEDASKLLTGEDYLLDMEHDDIMEELTAKSIVLDPLTRQALEIICSSFLVVCVRQLKDHLAGGKYSEWTDTLAAETTSVPRTNVGPERAFGMLDHLMKLMPRATTIALESLTMWKINHTAEWIDELDENKRRQIMEKARKSKTAQREQFVKRKELVKQGRLQKQQSKEQAKEQKEQKERVKRTNYTTQLQDFGGLWTTSQAVATNLQELNTENQKRKALEAQIRFRRHVLGAKNVNGILAFSSGGRKLPLEQLTNNLLSAIAIAREEDGQETEEDDSGVHYSPVEVEIMNREKEKFRTTIRKLQKSAQGKRQKTAASQTSVEEPEDLLGKRVEHLWETEQHGRTWYHGIVIDLSVKRGHYMFKIRYDGEKEIMELPLMEDLQKHDLRIPEIDPLYLVGKYIRHKFVAQEDGQEYWFRGRVLGFNNSTRLHTVHYEAEEDDGDDEDNDLVSDEPLLDDYRNNDVQLLDLPITIR